MSKESRRRKRAMRALQQEMIDTGELSTGGDSDIITGDMIERMSEMNHKQDFHVSGFTVTDKRRSNYTRNQNQGHLPGVWTGNGEYNGGGGGSSGYRQNSESDTTFRCDSDEITDPCPIAKTPGIDIPKRLWQEFCDLAEGFKTEWLAYLEGKFDEKGNRYVIERCYFPPQVVTGAHVEVDDDYEALPGTIGAIHSHVNMGAFWSGEDKAHSNWPVEIVINARQEYEALVRMKLECGKWAKAKGKVWLIYPRSTAAYSDALKKAIEKGDALAEERRQKSFTSGYDGGGHISGSQATMASTQSALVKAPGGHLITDPANPHGNVVTSTPSDDTPALVIDMESGQVQDKTIGDKDNGGFDSQTDGAATGTDRTEPDPSNPSVLFNCKSCGFWHTAWFRNCRRGETEATAAASETGTVPDSTGHSLAD